MTIKGIAIKIFVLFTFVYVVLWLITMFFGAQQIRSVQIRLMGMDSPPAGMEMLLK